MSCDRCNANPELRKGWGCDEPTPYPFATLMMRGRRIDLYRCPVQEIRRTPKVLEALTAYRWLNGYGIPPNAGGFSEQPRSFVEAVSVIEDERATIERSRRSG